MSNVLFEEGNWRIARNQIRGNPGSAIHHHCDNQGRLQDRWWHSTGPTACAYCKVKIPEEIKLLWMLHECV